MGSSSAALCVAPAPASAFDPSLAALFASSAGPIKTAAPARAVTLSSSNAEVLYNADSGSEDSSSENEDTPAAPRPAKRRRVAEPDLEADYFERLAREEEREQQRQKEPQRCKKDADPAHDSDNGNTNEDDTEVSDEAENDEEGNDQEDNDSDDGSDQEDDDDAVPAHESLTNGSVAKDKASRTVFLSNVSTAAIKSKSSKKILLDHLQSAIPPDQLPTTKLIQSFRFRSTAYVADGGPKRATYAKKELMEQTSHSTNAYAVFASEQAANLVVEKLNGTVVLDRHLRLDQVSSPAPIDHKRCVFIGNLPFMDEELSEKTVGQDGVPRRAKAKQPADAEEGLWRAFSKAGKVENVRVVRDKETRVSKGFAYVQFADPNAVEAALLFDGKKFPPLLPRILRVSRAKRPRSSTKSVPSSNKSFAGDSSRRNRPYQQQHSSSKQPSNLIFEGHRASSSKPYKHAKPKKRASKPTSRSARRGASFKASGGVKNRDRK